jgi:NADPH2:quinone reductase
MMRAMLPTGDPSLPVRLGTVRQPVVSREQVLVAVSAYSINRGETFLLERPPEGWRPGKDVAGRIVALGAGVSGLAIGQRVLGHPEQGGWAERVAVAADRLTVLPDTIDDTVAAALPLAGLTALRLTRVCGPLASRRLLITGASGGVGHYFVELAAAQGCEITAVAASPQRGAGLLALGAADIVQEVEHANGPFDVAVETVGAGSLQHAWSKLRQDGRLVWMGQASRIPPTFDFLDWRGATSGTLRRFHYAEDPTPISTDLATLTRLVAQGRLHPEIGLLDDWTATNDTIAALLARSVRGNAVLTIGENG